MLFAANAVLPNRLRANPRKGTALMQTFSDLKENKMKRLIRHGEKLKSFPKLGKGLGEISLYDNEIKDIPKENTVWVNYNKTIGVGNIIKLRI